MKSKKQKRSNHKDCFVKVTNLETNEVKFFKNGMDASREIGCSHVLVYKALNNKGVEKGNWRVEYISMDDPQCDEFKKKEDERICHLRK